MHRNIGGKMNGKIKNNLGFSIVEIIVVIVVIGILSAVTFVSYTGVIQRANVASIQSDLASVKKQILFYQTNNGTFPSAIDDCPSPAAGNICFVFSNGATFEYELGLVSGQPSFSLTASKGDISYIITNRKSAVEKEHVAPPPPPPPVATIEFESQELYVAWPGNDQVVCKEWTVPENNTIKGLYISQETEEGYDFFIVSVDGTERYNESGYFTNEYVDLSSTPGEVISACMSTDESDFDGYGGEVTGVYYN